MTTLSRNEDWTTGQLLVAFALYREYGELSSTNPTLIRCSDAIGRSPGAIQAKLGNIASLDPAVRSLGRTGLSNSSKADRDMWEEMELNPNNFKIQMRQALASALAVWTDDQLLVAFELYCQLHLDDIYETNPMIAQYAEAIGQDQGVMYRLLHDISSLDSNYNSQELPDSLIYTSKLVDGMLINIREDWGRFAVESERALNAVGLGSHPESDRSDENSDEENTYQLKGDDRVALKTERVGQSFFRKTLLSIYNERCCITDLSIPSLLIASHIVPWRHDKDNRVNPRNGLLLSALHDKAFDKGLITVDEDMSIQVSNKLREDGDEFLSRTIAEYQGQRIRLPEKFAPGAEFLAYHRKNIFLG